jgi:hypothetical protein
LAAEFGNLGMVKRIVEDQGVDVNMFCTGLMERKHPTPLFCAAKWNREDVLAYLSIQSHKIVFEILSQLCTALERACYNLKYSLNDFPDIIR